MSVVSNKDTLRNPKLSLLINGLYFAVAVTHMALQREAVFNICNITPLCFYAKTEML